MKKIIFITVLLLITTIVLAALYFSSLFMDNRNSSKVLGYIPADASVVMQFTNDNSFYEIFKDYKLFNDIIGKTREKELRVLKSSLLANSQISQRIADQKIFLSFHNQQDSVSFLWLTMLADKIDLSEFKKEAGGKFSLTDDKSEAEGNNRIFQIKFRDLKKPFFIFMDGQVVIGSFSRELVQRSINEDEAKISESFINEIGDQDIKNQNSLINLYFNLGTFRKYLSNYFKNNTGENLALLDNVNGISTLNLNFKSDALMFNGISKPDTASVSFLNLFLRQKPVKNTLMRVVPENTSNYLLFGLSDYRRFTADLRTLLKKRKQLDGLAKQIQHIADENGISPERDIKGLWGNEFITFQLSNHEKLAAIKVSNGRQLQFLLEPLSKKSVEGIRQINYPDVFYYYFGDALKPFRRPYYFIADNTIFIANSSGALQRFNDQYGSNRFLYKTEYYRNFEQLAANQSNITLFIHNNNSTSIGRSQLKPAFAKVFKDPDYELENFYGLSYQWSGDSHHFFTNLYIAYKPGILKPSTADDVDVDSLSGYHIP